MSTAWWRLAAVLPPILLLAIPILLREGGPAGAPAEHTEHLVIIGPNNETICTEFSHAFALYARRELHAEVVIDWRTPGGTSEIVKLVDEQFKAAFKKVFGRDCGCDGRRAEWNQLYPISSTST